MLFAEARRFDASDEATRRAAVVARIRAVLEHALERSSFYQQRRVRIERLLAEPDPERFLALFRELPPLTKEDLVERFDAIVTDPELSLERVRAFDESHADGLGVLETHESGRLQVIKTSGTSGKMVYVVDRIANIKSVMALLLFRALVRVAWQARLFPVLVPFLRPWVRLFRRRDVPRTPPRAPATYRPTLGERLSRFTKPAILVFVHRGNRSVYRGTTSHSQPLWARCLLHAVVLSHEETLASILARTQWVDPEFIFGLPSRIEWLAKAQLAGELAIDPLAIYVGGETLHAELAELFQRAFPRAKVINTYGATETKAIATACAECGELHLLEDVVHLETYDADGEPVREGEVAAQVYATSLRNFIVPVVRYAMTDRIVRLPDAGCRWRTGRIRVQGREPAFLWAPHRRTGEWIPLNGRMLKERLVGMAGSRGFMVRYVEPGRLELAFVVDALTEESEARVRAEATASVRALATEQGSSLEDVFPVLDVRVHDLEGWNRAGGKLNAIAATVEPPSFRASEAREPVQASVG